MRVPRRWIKWIVVGVLAVLLLSTLLIAPAQAGRAMKGTYHSLPSGVRALVPDAMERGLGGAVDGVTRFFSFGNPHQLIQMDLRLLGSSVPAGGWGPSHTFVVNWTNLGNGIAYEVRAGHSPSQGQPDVPLGRFATPGAEITVPADGDWFVRVRPYAGSTGGRTTTFGPFRIDSTIPPAPILDPIPPPPGYTFSLKWSGVTDASGIVAYQVERLGGGSLFQPVSRTPFLSFEEDQLGNGKYTYRIRAVNGAGLLSLPSNVQEVVVQAPMGRPGPGVFEYGIHANYTSQIQLWDLTDPGRYALIDEAPASVREKYLRGGWGFELDNQTLITKTREITAGERNTFKIAERLFVWLFDYADYDSDKLAASLQGQASTKEGDPCGDMAGGLQSAGCTYDRRKGICGDLATLYITMLRIAGVPARPVHGYLDNPAAGVGDFHVWVEVWVGQSIRGPDPSDTRYDWMTVDVSGAGDGDSSDPRAREKAGYDPEDLIIYFGIFNPEYLALGTDADYDDSSWNSWAQFAWSLRPNDPRPRFDAAGRPVELESESARLFFNTETRQRVLVEAGEDPPRGFSNYFPDVKTLSKKRIDYGADLTGTPINATIRIRFPVADVFANVLPWQSVIFTVYQKSSTVDPPDSSSGRAYRLDPLGYVVWEDDFESN